MSGLSIFFFQNIGNKVAPAVFGVMLACVNQTKFIIPSTH